MESTKRFKSSLGEIKVGIRDEIVSSQLIALSNDGKRWQYAIQFANQWHISAAEFGSADYSRIFDAAAAKLSQLVAASARNLPSTSLPALSIQEPILVA